MYEFPETQADRALGTLWSWMWPLLFVCTLTVLSMATQKYSGYAGPQIVEAHASQLAACPE
jgi:hypothetical protein